MIFLVSRRRRQTRCALVTGVQTCARRICGFLRGRDAGDAAGGQAHRGDRHDDPAGGTKAHGSISLRRRFAATIHIIGSRLPLRNRRGSFAAQKLFPGSSNMLSEFREFIAKGNVMDLAVGVIIGGAFATITGSLTEDLLMTFVGWLFGGVDFSSKFILLGGVPDGIAATDYAKLKEAGVAMIGYGAFITAVINFLILAFLIFLLVKWVNKVMLSGTAATSQEKRRVGKEWVGT